LKNWRGGKFAPPPELIGLRTRNGLKQIYSLLTKINSCHKSLIFWQLLAKIKPNQIKLTKLEVLKKQQIFFLFSFEIEN